MSACGMAPTPWRKKSQFFTRIPSPSGKSTCWLRPRSCDMPIDRGCTGQCDWILQVEKKECLCCVLGPNPSGTFCKFREGKVTFWSAYSSPQCLLTRQIVVHSLVYYPRVTGYPYLLGAWCFYCALGLLKVKRLNFSMVPTLSHAVGPI